MWWIILAVVVLVVSVFYGLAAFSGDAMVDRPNFAPPAYPMWPAYLGILTAIGLFTWRGLA